MIFNIVAALAATGVGGGVGGTLTLDDVLVARWSMVALLLLLLLLLLPLLVAPAAAGGVGGGRRQRAAAAADVGSTLVANIGDVDVNIGGGV